MPPPSSNPIFKVGLRGAALLTSPRWNKGTAFTAAERHRFGLTGRLPFTVDTLDQQCQRALDQLRAHENDIRKNAFLQSLKAQNWVLYYALIGRHLKELMPVIYTPTEADAIAQYSHLFRRSEGLYLTLPNQDTMEDDYLEQTRGRNIDLVVCSDAEAILGIGDQGVGGIGISTAKAAVYTLIAGVDPSKSLSVTLDVGTNNKDLLNDPLYVGWQNERVRGEEYSRFVDKFVQLVRKHHPHSLLHFEDFGVSNAQRLLELYRDKHAVFNDDVQGTGAVTLAALTAAISVASPHRMSPDDAGAVLAEQRIVIFGAGSAGVGIARQLRDAMLLSSSAANNEATLSREQANSRIWLVDRFGLVVRSFGEDKLRKGTEEFARDDGDWASMSLDEGDKVDTNDAQKNEDGSFDLYTVVKHVRPTILIGTSTVSGAFSEEVIREMAKHVERPIIFPLSNPTRLVEAKPCDLMQWTDGKALLATGSPFDAVELRGGKKYDIAECNNALIYPGLGLGAILSKSRTLSDGMIIAGAQRLAALSPALKSGDPSDALLPDFGDSPMANLEVAIAVIEHAVKEGGAGIDWTEGEVRGKVEEALWKPLYGEYVFDVNGDV